MGDLLILLQMLTVVFDNNFTSNLGIMGVEYVNAFVKWLNVYFTSHYSCHYYFVSLFDLQLQTKMADR